MKRDQEVKPLLENLRDWCEKNKSKILKSTPIGNAIHYFLNEYSEISGFLKNG
ncbi:MAG: transposase, partial [Bdellovibrionaceae bacterium]|nr:transposase [Pseudobdellovibrionaceae bacterium]